MDAHAYKGVVLEVCAHDDNSLSLSATDGKEQRVQTVLGRRRRSREWAPGSRGKEWAAREGASPPGGAT